MFNFECHLFQNLGFNSSVAPKVFNSTLWWLPLFYPCVSYFFFFHCLSPSSHAIVKILIKTLTNKKVKNVLHGSLRCYFPDLSIPVTLKKFYKAIKSRNTLCLDIFFIFWQLSSSIQLIFQVRSLNFFLFNFFSEQMLITLNYESVFFCSSILFNQLITIQIQFTLLWVNFLKIEYEWTLFLTDTKVIHWINCMWEHTNYTAVSILCSLYLENWNLQWWHTFLAHYFSKNATVIYVVLQGLWYYCSQTQFDWIVSSQSDCDQN